MKKSKFKVGDRVAYNLVDNCKEYDTKPKLVPWFIHEYGEDPTYGTVTDLLNGGKVMVQWDDHWNNAKFVGGVEAKVLLLESDMKARIVSLEKEFKEAEKEIKVKMKEAASLIKEANKIANTTGNNLAEMYSSVSSLVAAMDASGWRSSSWGC